MADAYHVFTRSIFFNPEMADTYNNNIERYTNYFISVTIKHRCILAGISVHLNKV